MAKRKVWPWVLGGGVVFGGLVLGGMALSVTSVLDAFASAGTPKTLAQARDKVLRRLTDGREHLLSLGMVVGPAAIYTIDDRLVWGLALAHSPDNPNRHGRIVAVAAVGETTYGDSGAFSPTTPEQATVQSVAMITSIASQMLGRAVTLDADSVPLGQV